jgi:siroheme synthase
LPTIVKKLLEYGRSPETRVAVIGSGTTSGQENVLGTLADIVERSTSIEPPALIVVGDVVSMAAKLQWFNPSIQHQPVYDREHTREPPRA